MVYKHYNGAERSLNVVDDVTVPSGDPESGFLSELFSPCFQGSNERVEAEKVALLVVDNDPEVL